MVRPGRKRKLPIESENQVAQLDDRNVTHEEVHSHIEESITQNGIDQPGSSQITSNEPVRKVRKSMGPIFQKLNRAIGALSTRLNNLSEEIRVSKSVVVETRGDLIESVDNEQGPNLPVTENQGKTKESGEDLTGEGYKMVTYNVRNINLEKPKFGEKEMNPVTFLEDLELYLKKAVRENNEIDLIQECLVGDARDWSRIYKSRWKELNDFKKDFLATFWGDKEQNELRRSIVQGTWDKSTTMLNHFLRITGKAQLLGFKIPEKQLVSDLIRHYPKYVQQGWYVSKIESIIETAEFLRNMDNVNNQDTSYALPRYTSGTNKDQDKRRKEIQQNYNRQWNKPANDNYDSRRKASMAIVSEESEIQNIDLN